MLQSPTSLILASASATRLALLHAAGLRATARPARIDEAALKQSARAEGATASGTALMLATLKAIYAHAADPAGEDTLVIGADQLLTCGDAWSDKPATRAEARAHLRHLRGRTHTLHTAVTCLRGGIEVWHHVATPRLAMRRFSDAFLDAYLDTEGDAVLSSVGAYRLEGPGLQLFEHIDGEHSAILGLPMLPPARLPPPARHPPELRAKAAGKAGLCPDPPGRAALDWPY